MTVNNAWDQIKNLVWNVFNRPTIADVLDIFIVAYLIYKLLMLTKETRASAVLKGLVMLIAASWISDLLGLTALSWVLQNVVANGAVVLVILIVGVIFIVKGCKKEDTPPADGQQQQQEQTGTPEDVTPETPVNVDDELLTVESYTETVQNLLERLQIRVGADEMIGVNNTGLKTLIHIGDELRCRRRETTVDTYKTKVLYDYLLPYGEHVILQEGTPGATTDTYDDVYRNGELVNTVLVDRSNKHLRITFIQIILTNLKKQVQEKL